MILQNVKPLMIIWLPVGAAYGTTELVEIAGNLNNAIGDSFKNDAVDYVLRRTVNEKVTFARIPIPFYFYENLFESKSNAANQTGFILDSCVENIDLSYADTPTTQSSSVGEAVGSALNANNTFTVKNTLEVSFRVKNGSTIVSVLRALMKRVLTDPLTARDIRFSWYWREYIMSESKCIDYNEAPVTGTDLTLIKIKLQKTGSEEEKSGGDTLKEEHFEGKVKYEIPANKG